MQIGYSLLKTPNSATGHSFNVSCPYEHDRLLRPPVETNLAVYPPEAEPVESLAMPNEHLSIGIESLVSDATFLSLVDNMNDA